MPIQIYKLYKRRYDCMPLDNSVIDLKDIISRLEKLEKIF